MSLNVDAYPFSVMVFTNGAEIVAIDKAGTVIAEGQAGTDDTAVIQAAIDTLPEFGLLVLNGDFAVTDCLIVKGDMTIDGLGASRITGQINRSETNYGIFYTTEDIEHCKIRNLRMVRLAGGMGGVVAFNGDSAYQYRGCGLYNCDCYSENANCFTYSCGDGFEVMDCTLRGSDVANGQAVEIGYCGQPRFSDCRILGGSWEGTSYGLLFTDNGGGLFTNCTIEGRNYGAMVTSSANPRFVGCEITTTHGVPLTVQGAAAPIFQGCAIHPKIYSAKWGYQGIDQIDPIVTGEAYRILSMHVRVDQAQDGVTLDIGTTPGGSDIANDVPLYPAGFRGITAPWNVRLYSDAPIYLTLSSPIANGCLRIMYSIVLNPNNAALYSTTIGNARFANCYLLGGPGGTYLTADAATFLNSVIECPDRTQYAVNYSSLSVARFHDCTVLGEIRNVSGWAT